MEDQGKRLLLAVAIAFGIMMAWSLIFPPKKPDKKETTDKAKTAEQATPDKSGPAPTPGTTPATPDNKAATPAQPTPGTPEVPPAPEAPRAEATLVEFDFPTFHAVFTSHGAALKSWTLQGERFEDRDHGGQIDLVPTGAFGEDHGDLYPLLISFATAEGAPSHVIPAKTNWQIEKKTANSVDFLWTSDDLWVEKSFEIDPDDYLVKMSVRVKKLSAGQAKLSLVVSSFGFQNPDFKGNGRLSRVDRSFRTACYVGGELHTNSEKYLLDKGPHTYNGTVRWAGIVHAYFLTGFSLKPEGDVDRQSKCVASAVAGAPKGTIQVAMTLGPPKELDQNSIYGRSFTVYMGPKYLGKLGDINKVAGWDTGFDDSVNLGWFGFIARPLLWLLRTFQSVVVNWGLAIILLTVFVKLATLYWTNKSMRSMREMAKLKPKVEEIQKKYKDDRQKAQVEIMGLYKAHGVNPLSGCLPMVLQMPIWIALYQTLRVAAELFQAPFIPGWIDDLTAPDHYYVLPVLLMGMMFIQAKLTPSTADSMQQKMMQYGLPLVFGVFGFFFPAGLTLYIFTNTCLTALHHLWLRREHDVPGAAVAAVAATSGRKAGSSTDDEGDDKGFAGEPMGGAGKSDGEKSSKSGARKKGGSGKGKKKKR